MSKKILSVLAGIIGGGMIILLVEKLGHTVYPPPPDFDYKDVEALRLLIENAPLGALLFVVLAWALGSLAGGLIAALIAVEDKTKQALFVGGILMVLGVINMMSIPHPVWMQIAGLTVYLPFAYWGGTLGSKMNKRKNTETSQ